MLATVLTAVVYIQTQRLADQAAEQNEQLMIQSATAATVLAEQADIAENLKFVRQAVIDDSRILPFSGLNLRGVTLQRLDLGCRSNDRRECADFSRSVLSSSDLQGTQLNGAVMTGTDLSSANLGYANLNGAFLSFADMSSATLRSAHLRFAVLVKAELNGANLRLADLTSADLTGADVSYADFRGADLTDATLVDLTCDRTRWPEEAPSADCDRG